MAPDLEPRNPDCGADVTVTIDRPGDLPELLTDLAARISRLERRSGGVFIADDGTAVFPDGIDTSGTGDVSNPPLSPGDPDPPTGLTSTPGALFDDVFVDLDWTAPGDTTNLAGYELRIDHVENPGGAEVLTLEGIFALPIVTEERIRGLRPNETYDVTLWARNATGGLSATSISDRFTTGADNTTPAQVVGLSVSAGIRTVVASWTENTEADVADGRGAYELELDTVNTFDSGSERTVRLGGTVATLGDLTTSTTYYVRVRAIDASGNSGPWSATASTTTVQAVTADLADDLITAAKIVDGAVGSVALADDAVTNAKIAVDAITATEIADGAVGTLALAADAVTSAKIAVDAVTSSEIAANAVTAAEIAANAVTSSELADLAVTTAKLVDDAITSAKIATDAVTSDAIVDGAVDYAALASGLEPVRPLGALPTLPDANYPSGAVVFLTTDGKIYRNVSGTWTAEVATGDLTGTITETQIADDAITTPKIAANAVTATEIAASTITSAQIAADTITAGNIAASAITASEIAADAVTTAKIAAGAVTASEIAANTITAAEIAALTITAAEIAANTITASEIAALTITAGEIAASTITGAKIAADTITAGNIAAGAITASEIAADAVTTAKIQAGAITTTELAADAVTAAKIAAGTITATEIAASTITSSEIAADTITAANIAAGAVATSELAADAVTAAKILAGTITATEIAAGTITADRMVAGTITAASGILADAVITEAKIADLAVTDAKIDNLTVSKLTAGNLTVDATLTSGSIKVGTGPGSTGLYLDSAGLRAYSGATRTVFIDAATGDAEFTGTITATDGAITGDIEVTGQIVLTSGDLITTTSPSTDAHMRTEVDGGGFDYIAFYGTGGNTAPPGGSGVFDPVFVGIGETNIGNGPVRELVLQAARHADGEDTAFILVRSSARDTPANEPPRINLYSPSNVVIDGDVEINDTIGGQFGGTLTTTARLVVGTTLLVNSNAQIDSFLDLNGQLLLNGYLGSGSRTIQHGGGYDIWVDNVGNGTAGRYWLDTPDDGEVVIGPRAGANELNRVRVRASYMLMEGTFLPFDGTTSAPAYSFNGDSNSGGMLFANGDNRWVINGAYRWQWSSEVAVVNTNLRADANNARHLGTSSVGWAKVWRYAEGVPSDPSIKGDVEDVPVDASLAVLRAFAGTGIKEYRYTNSLMGAETDGSGNVIADRATTRRQGRDLIKSGRVPMVPVREHDDRNERARHRGVMAPDLRASLLDVPGLRPEAIDHYVSEPEPDVEGSTWGVSYSATIPDLINVVADLAARLEAAGL